MASSKLAWTVLGVSESKKKTKGWCWRMNSVVECFPSLLCMPGSRFNLRLRVYDHQGAWKPSQSPWGTVADGREKRGWRREPQGWLVKALPFLTIFMAAEEISRRAHTAEDKVRLELRKCL